MNMFNGCLIMFITNAAMNVIYTVAVFN